VAERPAEGKNVRSAVASVQAEAKNRAEEFTPTEATLELNSDRTGNLHM
jgi:hypothetical protein